MIQVNNVTLRLGKRALFEDVNIKFTEGNCYGLIGANGAGKSTFLKILSGEIEPSKGDVSITSGQRLSVLKQDHYQYDDHIVLDTVMMGNQRLYEIMKEKEALYAKEDFTDEDGIRASELEGEFADMNGWEAESDAATLLNGLGIPSDIHYTKMADLNGSQKVKVLLAQALFGNPDILLLDEPTNHLDLDAIYWLDIPITVFESDIFDAVYEIEKSPCYLCARMRRGYLYSKAKELGCNKIALGHHYDDVIETILMGMLYGAQVQTMMPKLHSTNFEGMELIRPMYLIREDDIKHWRDYNGLHFIQCACKFTDTCTTCNPDGVTKSKRMETKQLIAKMKEINPYVESNIFKSVENVNLKTIIAYKKDGVKHSFLDTYDQEN